MPLTEGGWAPLPDGWLDKHGQRVPICWPRRGGRRQPGAARAAGPGALCDELEHPSPPGLARLGAAAATSTASRGAAARRPARRTLRAYQRRGVDWLAFLRRRAWAACSPTTWASARRCRRCARSQRPHAGGVPDERAASTGAPRSQRFRPGLRVASTTAPRAHARSRRRRDAHDATRSCASTPTRCRRSSLGHGRPRRGAGDQEPRQPGRARRLRAARRASASP